MVPNAISPASARARSAGLPSRSQAILLPEKYGSRTRPVRSWKTGSWPSAFSRAQISAVWRLCQTIAR